MDKDELEAYKLLREKVARTSQNKDDFKESMLYLLESFSQDSNYAGSFIFDKDGEDDLSQYEMAQRHLSANIDMIYAYAESPIERLFLCNLQLMAFRINPFFITVTPPITVDTAIRNVHPIHKRLVKIRNAVRRKEHGPDISDVYNRIKAQQELMDLMKQIIPMHISALGDNMSKLLGYFEHGLGESFHISLQPSFETLRVENRVIRPDMVLWYPRRLDFKVVVECDGYDYHSDKETFAKDRVRDRVLQQQGYQVFRFSGREIVQNATLKVDEFLHYLFELSEQFDLKLQGPKGMQTVTPVHETDDDLEQSTSSPRKKKKPSAEQKKRQRHEQRHRR